MRHLETTRMLEAIERMPKHVLFRAIRKQREPQALLELLNLAHRHMQDGLSSWRVYTSPSPRDQGE